MSMTSAKRAAIALRAHRLKIAVVQRLDTLCPWRYQFFSHYPPLHQAALCGGYQITLASLVCCTARRVSAEHLCCLFGTNSRTFKSCHPDQLVQWVSTSI